LTRGPEQVHDEIIADGDPAEVHRDRGRRLLLHAVERVHELAPLAQRLLGPQRPDLADRADERRLSRAEAARNQNLDRYRRHYRGWVSISGWVRIIGAVGHRPPPGGSSGR